MNTRSEESLIQGAQAFDPKTLAEIYDRFSPGLYAYAMRLLGDECLAEDCVSETFSRFLKSLRSGSGPNQYLQAYLYRIAHNWITDFYRRNSIRLIEIEEELPAHESAKPEVQVDFLLQQAEVRRALRLLTPDQRQVILLRFFEGWENDEVAAAIQKPVGAVKALQHRALSSLKRWLLDSKEEDHFSYEHGN